MSDEEAREENGPADAKDAKDATAPERPKRPKRSKRDSGSWGFPAFAREFPHHPELDALVAAFARGDYAAVRERAPALAKSTDDEAVRKAAETLRARIEPDPTAKILFAFAGALLVFLTVWWVTHDGPPHGTSAPSKPVPTVEFVDRP